MYEAIQKLLAKLSVVFSGAPSESGKQILNTALQTIGIDASPADLAPDEFGCAESVCDVIRHAGFSIPIILSTAALYQWFLKSPDWLLVPSPLAGDVIISPTGYGGKNGIKNGHTGIIVNAGKIASNNSLTGLFDIHYTLDTWKYRYVTLGGYPIYFFRRLE